MNDSQIDEATRGTVFGDEDTLSLVSLFDYGVDVTDLSDGFQDLLVLVPVEVALLLALLDHLVVLFHQSPP